MGTPVADPRPRPNYRSQTGRGLNPDECLNADLKRAVGSQAPVRSKPDLKRAAIRHMRKLSKSPKRVRSYFQHAPVRYAA